MVFSFDKSVFFISCWVIVEAPSEKDLFFRLDAMAFEDEFGVEVSYEELEKKVKTVGDAIEFLREQGADIQFESSIYEKQRDPK